MSTTGPLLIRPVRSHPLTSFALLACLFGWLPYILAAVGVGSEPENMPFGPVVAAAVVTACQGREVLRTWAWQLLRWGAAPGWYALAVLTPIVVHLAIVGLNHLWGAPLPTGDQLAGWPQIPVVFVIMLLMVGIGEEAGWTAFAAPLLLRRHGLLGAWAVLAAVRTFWHLPLMLSGDMPWLMGILGNVGFQLVVLWMMQASDGRWTLAAVWHATLNAFGGMFFFQMVTGTHQEHLSLLLGIAYAALGAACLTAPMRRLANRRHERLEDLASVAGTHPATVGRR